MTRVIDGFGAWVKLTLALGAFFVIVSTLWVDDKVDAVTAKPVKPAVVCEFNGGLFGMDCVWVNPGEVKIK